MAPNRGPNRARDFEDLVQNANEIDPEDDERFLDDADDSDADSGEDDAKNAPEHYVDVGKSKLRKAKEVALGPQYRGSKVSRHAVDGSEDGDDDPFSKDFGESESEAESASLGQDDETDEETGDESDAPDDDATSDTDMTDEDQSHRPKIHAMADKDRAELRKAVDGRAQKTMTAAISQANREDAEKGRAVKRQRATFDSLLSSRMKLQKALIATNTLVGTPQEQLEVEVGAAQPAFEAAETAAFNLWNSLTSLREEMNSARAGQKRKRLDFSPSTPIEELWATVQAQEAQSRSNRDTVLRKWSDKAQSAAVSVQQSRLSKNEGQTNILDVIQEQLSNMDRLVKRTHAPRSCAPLQVSQRVAEDDKIYDDADFYGLMLKELLEQRSHDSVTTSNLDVGFQMRRENKTRKNVDTKASKGRKLRYTVHEKLQNFMAPEDRCAWGERQADELFGSLFGQRFELGEKGDGVDTDKEEDENLEEAGLLMFRN